MTIQIDQETLDEFQGTMQTSGTIELPFPVPYIWVINGDLKLKELGGPQAFGGWQVEAEKMLEAGLPYGQTEPPSGYVRKNVLDGKGKQVDSFLTRSVIVAPIDFRKSWFMKTPGGLVQRSADYFEGSRQHAQALVYLAGKKEGVFQPWGPAVLSAKGWQVKNLLKAFESWNKATTTPRQKVAPGVPAWFFYLAIGTFGAEVNTVMVGKGSDTSPITPISAYIPEKITEEQVESLFVGQEVADDMAMLKRDAQEWLHAWGSPTPRGTTQVQPAAILEETGGYAPEEPQFSGDEPDIPF
jgi:hypothetical protein